MDKIKSSPAAQPYPHPSNVAFLWIGLLVVWFVSLCLLPDPRPLGAPEWAFKAIQKLTGTSEPAARIIATILLRVLDSAGIGILLVQALGRIRRTWAVWAPLAVAPLLAVTGMWINYGYYPIAQQIWISAGGAVLGVLAGLIIRRNRAAVAALVVLLGFLIWWGTATGISDDLDEDARATASYILENIDRIPDGDAGFEHLMQIAFSYAADNSHRHDPVHVHRAAILALGTMLGDEQVSDVAKRTIDPSRLPEIQALRRRITLYGRNDLSRHFWVSAALTVLSDETRSITVGLAKELMDANGGSGFSFVDLTADRAGTLFTLAATRNENSASSLQENIRHGARITNFMPNVLDLPEGISSDDFHSVYGGLGGDKTAKIVEEIRNRLQQCEGLQL